MTNAKELPDNGRVSFAKRSFGRNMKVHMIVVFALLSAVAGRQSHRGQLTSKTVPTVSGLTDHIQPLIPDSEHNAVLPTGQRTGSGLMQAESKNNASSTAPWKQHRRIQSVPRRHKMRELLFTNTSVQLSGERDMAWRAKGFFWHDWDSWKKVAVKLNKQAQMLMNDPTKFYKQFTWEGVFNALYKCAKNVLGTLVTEYLPGGKIWTMIGCLAEKGVTGIVGMSEGISGANFITSMYACFDGAAIAEGLLQLVCAALLGPTCAIVKIGAKFVAKGAETVGIPKALLEFAKKKLTEKGEQEKVSKEGIEDFKDEDKAVSKVCVHLSTASDQPNMWATFKAFHGTGMKKSTGIFANYNAGGASCGIMKAYGSYHCIDLTTSNIKDKSPLSIKAYIGNDKLLIGSAIYGKEFTNMQGLTYDSHSSKMVSVWCKVPSGKKVGDFECFPSAICDRQTQTCQSRNHDMSPACAMKICKKNSCPPSTANWDDFAGAKK